LWEGKLDVDDGVLEVSADGGMELDLKHEECLSGVQRLNCGWTDCKIRPTSNCHACFNVRRKTVVVVELLFFGELGGGLPELMVLDWIPFKINNKTQLFCKVVLILLRESHAAFGVDQ